MIFALLALFAFLALGLLHLALRVSRHERHLGTLIGDVRRERARGQQHAHALDTLARLSAANSAAIAHSARVLDWNERHSVIYPAKEEIR